ncbi:MAG TPA: hypothetical protein VN442_00615 [Bryobacteraceae bacterium]|nr:hypothetical protein [Bryobacteraceae bacterium]
MFGLRRWWRAWRPFGGKLRWSFLEACARNILFTLVRQVPSE